MKILNLYAGIGGNRKLWGVEHEITAVEYDEATAEVYSQYFPKDKMIIADAHEYLLNHYKEYDFIWSSPPCPTHSKVRLANRNQKHFVALYPNMELYEEIIFLQEFSRDSKWVVENVKPYYEPLIPPSKILQRHYYWSNFNIKNGDIKDTRKHNDIEGNSEVYGFTVVGSKIKNKRKALRNMVNPELGKHILDCAMGVMQDNNKEQLQLI